MKKYFTQLDTNGKTTSGWAVDKQKTTSDPRTVTPDNKATVALYTYTPWVGAYGEGCGTSKWAGKLDRDGALYVEISPVFRRLCEHGHTEAEGGLHLDRHHAQLRSGER